jgi:hypothetical protein
MPRIDADLSQINCAIAIPFGAVSIGEQWYNRYGRNHRIFSGLELFVRDFGNQNTFRLLIFLLMLQPVQTGTPEFDVHIAIRRVPCMLPHQSVDLYQYRIQSRSPRLVEQRSH